METDAQPVNSAGVPLSYDILIIGGGVIGCAIARELSLYSLKVVLLEKEGDVAKDRSALPYLEKLLEQGKKNGSQGLSIIGGEAIRAVEPDVRGEFALYLRSREEYGASITRSAPYRPLPVNTRFDAAFSRRLETSGERVCIVWGRFQTMTTTIGAKGGRRISLGRLPCGDGGFRQCLRPGCAILGLRIKWIHAHLSRRKSR